MIMKYEYVYLYTAWCFGTWICYFAQPVVGMMIQSDEVIFFWGDETTNMLLFNQVISWYAISYYIVFYSVLLYFIRLYYIRILY